MKINNTKKLFELLGFFKSYNQVLFKRTKDCLEINGEIGFKMCNLKFYDVKFNDEQEQFDMVLSTNELRDILKNINIADVDVSESDISFMDNTGKINKKFNLRMLSVQENIRTLNVPFELEIKIDVDLFKEMVDSCIDKDNSVVILYDGKSFNMYNGGENKMRNSALFCYGVEAKKIKELDEYKCIYDNSELRSFVPNLKTGYNLSFLWGTNMPIKFIVSEELKEQIEDLSLLETTSRVKKEMYVLEFFLAPRVENK